jgi:cytochrome c peroxidase
MNIKKYAALCALFAISAIQTAPVRANDLLGLPPVPVPADNAQTPEKIALGQKLYFDTRFSSDGTVACGTCHSPAAGYSDGRPVGRGVKGQEGARNSPSVLNAAYYTTMFWDGRAPTLEEQAKGPLTNPIEHGLKNHGQLLDVVRRDEAYLEQFQRVFNVSANDITIDHVTKAIASFERTIVAGNSPFDRYQYKGDKSALSPAAVRGFDIFRTKGRCTICHIVGPENALFTDNKFHNIGVGLDDIKGDMFVLVNAFIESKIKGVSVDTTVLTGKNISHLGRFAVTMNPADLGNFKTPTLRNIELTGPYMHDGRFKTLAEVVDFYGKGGVNNSLQHQDIRDLRLSAQEQRDLVEFMKALTSDTIPLIGNRQARK